MSGLSDAIAKLEMSDELPEGELVVDVITISRLIHSETGRETFHIAVNKSISTIVLLGLMAAAEQVIADGDWNNAEEGDVE